VRRVEFIEPRVEPLQALATVEFVGDGTLSQR
jgi:hypothetical protein